MTKPMGAHYDHYEHTPHDLAAACRRGAADLRREAAEALKDGDQSRHDRKQRAADFADRYADAVRDGTADLNHAQIVAHAANMSGILVDPRMPDDPHRQQWDPEGLRAEQEYTAARKAELQSAADAGLISRVADPGQVAFYTLPGYEPDGYDPATQTTDLRDRQHERSPHQADTANGNGAAQQIDEDEDGMEP